MTLKLRTSSRMLAVLALILSSGSLGWAQLVERPLITGREAVVTSLEPLASMAGMRILQEGGNAFDAAVATALAVTCAGRGPWQELFSKRRTMKHKRPRTESLVAAAVQWAERIMRKIDNVFSG